MGKPKSRQGAQPNQWQVETQVPATQAEQVKYDMAPVTAEYVPAKANDEEYACVRQSDYKRFG
jgi:hypothetical protein